MNRAKNFTFGVDFSPEFLEKYDILGILGEGGMGQVYLGLQKSLNRKVAIKFLSGRVVMSERRIEKFHNEAKLCAEMRHPNIVELYDFGGGTSPDDRPYMVFELIDGESLADKIKREGALPVREALDIGIKICEGLQYAHEQGIVHRDMKSDNILISKDGKVKVADFGIAVANQQQPSDSAVSASTSRSRERKMIPGTPAYMSPEQARSEEATHLSDIYSTGVILYEMLCGHVPFMAETSMAIIIQHINNEPPSIRQVNPDVPPRLEELVFRALAKEPSERYQSAEEFKMKLKKAKTFSRRWKSSGKTPAVSGQTAATEALKLSRSVSFIARESPEEARRRKMIYGALGVFSMLVLAGLSWLLFGPSRPKVVSRKVEAGFTSARIGWNLDLPGRSCVEYWPGGAGAKARAIRKDDGVTGRQHTVLLEGLKEDAVYSYHILVDGYADGPADEFRTVGCVISSIRTRPLVNGVEVKWKSSIPLQSEAIYLVGRDVKRRARNKTPSTRHCFRIPIEDGETGGAIEIAVVAPGGFRKSVRIDDFRIIDKQVILRLTEAIHRISPSKDRYDFGNATARSFASGDIRRNLSEFAAFKDDFWSSTTDVSALDKAKLYRALLFMREFEMFALLFGKKVDTGVAAALSPAFGELYSNPLPASAPTVSPVHTPVRIRCFTAGDTGDRTEELEELVFRFSPPRGRRWRRACVAIGHGGFTALGLVSLTIGKHELLIFGKRSTGTTRIAPGTLYHTFDPRLIKSSGTRCVLTIVPLRGLKSSMIKEFDDFDGFRINIKSLDFCFSE